MDIPEIKPLHDESPSATGRSTSKSAKTERPPSGQTTFFSFGRDLDYYTSNGRRVGDFFAGLLIPVVFYFTLFLLGPLLHIAAIILCFIYKRTWLALGMLCSILLPILLYLFFIGAYMW